MIDPKADTHSTPEPETTFDEMGRRQQAALFALITKWMAAMSALVAAAYVAAYLATSDPRIVPILFVNAGFSFVATIVRHRVRHLAPAVYLISVSIAVGMVGVAASVSSIGPLIIIATALLPALFAGLLLTPRHMLPVTLFSVAATLVAAWIDHAAAWPRFDLSTVPAVRWIVHTMVGSMILILLVTLLRNLDRASREARESARQLRLLYETSRLFGAAATLDDLLPTAAKNLAHILNATGCFVILRDPASGELIPTAAYGLDQEIFSRMRLPSNEPSLVRTVVERRSPIVIENAIGSPYVNQRAAALVSAQSLIGLPMIHHEETFGAVLISETRRQRRFTQDEIARVQGLVQQVTAEIANAQAIERERRQAAELAILNRVGAAVATSLDPAEFCRRVINELGQAAGYELVSVYLLDGRTLRLQAVIGYDRMIHEMPIDRGILGKTARTGRPILLSDVSLDPDYIAALPDLTSEACAPIRFGDETLGVINVETRAPRVLNANDLNLLVAIAGQIAVMLRNAQLFEQTRHYIDELWLLYEIARESTATFDTSQVMHLVAGGLTRSLTVAACAFSRWDRASNCVGTIGKYVLDNNQIAVVPPSQLSYNLNEYPMTREVLETQSIRQLRSDVSDAPPEELALLGELGFASVLLLPLVTPTGTFGLIELYAQDARDFSPDEIARGMAIAHLAAIALERARLIEQTERRSREMEALHEIEQAITALDLDRCLHTVAVSARSLMNANLGHVFLGEAGGLRLRLRAASGPFEDQVGTWFLAQGRGLVGWAAAHRQAINVPDVHADPRYHHTVGTTQSEIAIPLIANDEVIGVLDVQSDKPAAFDEHDVALLGMLGAEAAIAIHNARLFESERAAREQAETLQVATQALSATLDLQEVFQLILSELRKVVPYDSASVQQVSGDRLEIIGGHGFPDLEELRGVSFDLTSSDNPNREVIRTQSPFILEDAPARYSEFHRGPHAQAGIRSWLGVPLRFGDRVIGMIALDKRTPGFYTEEHARLAMAFAAQAAIAIENARLLDQARRQAQRERLVHDINSKISASIEIHTVMQTAVEELGRALDVSRCVICLGADPDNMPVAYEFHQPGIPPLGRGQLEHLPTLTAALNERRTVVDLEPCLLNGVPVLSGLITPIFIRGHISGVVVLHQCDRRRRWTVDEVALIEDVGAQLGIAIDNAQLYQEATHSLSDLNLLHSMAMAVASAASLPEAVNRVVESVQAAIHCAQVALLLVEPDTRDLIVGAAVGYARNPLNVRIRAGQGVTGWAAQSGRPALVPDVLADSRYLDATGEGSIRSELAVPLIAGSEVVGVLNLESTERDAFDEASMQLLSTLGGNLAMIIRNLRLLDEVRAANARLQELDRLKSQFLANMSHELRTPLHSIIGFSEVLGDGLAGELNDDQREFIANIHSSGKHLLALINDVLDLSKMQSGKMELDCRPIAPREVIDEAGTVIAPLIAKKRQHLVVELAPDLPAVFADAFRLRQVLINLLSNAHKFSPEGSRITLAARGDDGFIRFSVTDQGDGIQSEDYERVFLEFVQVEDGMTRTHEGTGLGLPITRRLVDMHGGRIWIESQGVPGQGATFHFTLPIASASDTKVRASVPAPAPAIGNTTRRRALIIEDDRQFSNLLALYLGQQGYQPIQHYDGQSVVQLVRELRPAVVTLDLIMPGCDGRSVLHDLKSAPDTWDVPVIIISALNDSEIDLSQDALDYLTKPLDPDALLAALRRLSAWPELETMEAVP